MKIAGELGMEDSQSAPGLLSPVTGGSTAGDLRSSLPAAVCEARAVSWRVTLCSGLQRAAHSLPRQRAVEICLFSCLLGSLAASGHSSPSM